MLFTTLERIHLAGGCPCAVKCHNSDCGTGARVGAGKVPELVLGQLTSTTSNIPFNPPHLLGCRKTLKKQLKTQNSSHGLHQAMLSSCPLQGWSKEAIPVCH